MGISKALWLVAMLAMINLLGAGCAGPNWPRVHARADQRFLSHTIQVQSVDILPTDIEVWGDSLPAESLPELANEFDVAVSSAATAALAKRGYRPAAHMDWGGMYLAYDGTPQQGMSAEQVESTVYSLSGYAHAVEQAGQGLLLPYLPHRLGAQTGSDATLYIGGWAYVGKDPAKSTGQKVAEGVAIGVLVVALAVVIIVLLDKAGGKGGGGGKAVAAAGRGTGGVARVAVTAGRTFGRAFAPVLRGAARATAHMARGILRGVDALGRSNTHIHIYAGRPSYYEYDYTPKQGKSRMYLEMTLVDNHTGLVLWHARETFPAHAPRGQDVHKVFDVMMASLPASYQEVR